jgi:hypothetical protein
MLAKVHWQTYSMGSLPVLVTQMEVKRRCGLEEYYSHWLEALQKSRFEQAKAVQDLLESRYAHERSKK